MAISLKDKALAFFGVLYSCDKCGALYVGKENADKHEVNCKED